MPALQLLPQVFDISNPTHRFLALCYFLDAILWGHRLWAAIQPREKALNSKFSGLLIRKIVVVAHILAGVTEIIAGAVAFLTMNEYALYVTLIAALAVHTPTAILMTPKVYGARRLMVPAYIACIALHAYTAFMCWTTFNRDWLIATLAIAHTYAFVRIYYTILLWTKTTPGNEYTLAVLLSGATTIPYIQTQVEYHLLLMAFGFIGLYMVGSAVWDYLWTGEVQPSVEQPLPVANDVLEEKRAAKMGKSVEQMEEGMVTVPIPAWTGMSRSDSNSTLAEFASEQDSEKGLIV
ncbi:hypothetical protein HDV00_007351 [Rhizophlyctis rosea]|nr:hypothetical protein HDV00_007351 [Rhizophlyctis rosea]